MHLFVEKIVHLFVGFPISKVKLTFDSKNFHNSKYHLHSINLSVLLKKTEKETSRFKRRVYARGLSLKAKKDKEKFSNVREV